MPSTTLTEEALAALQRIGCPVTTPDLMRLLNRERCTPLVIDQVYRALNALRVRGVVRSLPSRTNKRLRYWEIVTEAHPCTCGAGRRSS